MDEDARVNWHDAWLPALLLVLGSAELASLGSRGWVASIALEAVAALLLVFRRHHALVIAPASAAALMFIPVTGTEMNDAAAPILFYILAVFSLGRRIPDLRGVVALVVILILIFTVSMSGQGVDGTDVAFVLSLAMPPYVLGRIVRRLDEQGRELAAQQDVIARQAAVEERSRISRELHDVIAHSISVMVVQTAAAQDVVRTDPDRASDLLASVADTGREALAEAGRLLHAVRDDRDELRHRPTAGLADVPTLVESFRAGGLPVELSIDVPDEPLPPGVDVSVFRIVQESLTNALKYGTGPVRLIVDADSEQLRIACSNRIGAAASNGAGLGLLGMAERVGLLGGTFRRGPTSDHIFVVEATVPLSPELAS